MNTRTPCFSARQSSEEPHVSTSTPAQVGNGPAHPRTIFLDYDARRTPKTDLFCVRCQKDIKGKPYRMVHVVDDGSQVLHPEDEHLYVPDNGDCGCHPIGPDCAKKLGLEWSWPA